MQILAQQNGGQRLLLAWAGDGPGDPGKVLDRQAQVLYAALPISSIVARGYWEDYTGKPLAEAELLRGVSRQPDPPAAIQRHLFGKSRSALAQKHNRPGDHPIASAMPEEWKEAEHARLTVLELASNMEQRGQEIAAEVAVANARMKELNTRADAGTLDEAGKQELGDLEDHVYTLLGEQAHAEMYINDRARAGLNQKSDAQVEPVIMSGDFLDREYFDDGLTAFERLAGAAIPPGEVVNVELDRQTSRASYVAEDNTVYLNPEDKSRTTVHEMGHWLEAANPEVHAAALAFLDRRAGHEAMVQMSAAANNPEYAPDEWTHADQFPNPYVGKVYDDGRSKDQFATEVISMGLESMYATPVQFASADPDHFRLIYNTMRNLPYEGLGAGGVNP